MTQLTFDDFDVYVRREVEYYLNGTNMRSKYYDFSQHQVLKLNWRNTRDDADVMFTITLAKDLSTIMFALDVTSDDDEDDDVQNHGVTDLPKSEEEYFQMSTVQELGFRWELYEYLINTFESLRT